MVGPVDMNIGVFWETSAGFLKSFLSQPFPKYPEIMSIWMFKVAQNQEQLKIDEPF